MLLPISSLTLPYEVTDDDLRATVRSLNTRQRYAFQIILKWCRDKVKNISSLQPFPVNPVYKFISGGAGAGKSHLIKAFYQTALKTFRCGPCGPELPNVLNNKTNDLILNLTPENVTQHSRIVTTTRKGSSTPTKISKIIGRQIH